MESSARWMSGFRLSADRASGPMVMIEAKNHSAEDLSFIIFSSPWRLTVPRDEPIRRGTCRSVCSSCDRNLPSAHSEARAGWSILDPADRDDGDGLAGDIFHPMDRHGGRRGDGVHDIQARGDLSENAVAKPFRRVARVIEEVVIHMVDEKLAGGTVDLARAGHGDRPPVVCEPVSGLVLDRRLGRAGGGNRGPAAALGPEC